MNEKTFALASSIREKDKMEESGLTVGDSIRDFVNKERFLLYSTLFSASEKLFISYITSSSDGESLKESDFIRSIRKILPTVNEVKTADESEESLVESEKSAFELMAKKWHENSPKAEALREYFRNKSIY